MAANLLRWTERNGVALLAVMLVFAGAAHADTRKVDAIADQATFVELFYIYDPADCSVKRILEADMVQPKGGVLFLQDVPTKITKGYCRGKTVRATGIFYRSFMGFRGRDVGRVKFRYATFDDSVINRRTKAYKVIADVR